MVDPRVALRAAAAMLATAALLTALVWMDPVQPENLAPIDTWWHDLVVPPGDLARAFARALAVLGGDVASVIVRVVVGIWLAARRRWRDLVVWLVAALLADIVVALLKDAIGRMRPDGSDLRSFPSGHAKYAGQLAVGLALVAVSGSLRRRRIVWAAAVAWIVLMGWSRTALDAHYLSDVLAGSLIGAGFALGVWAIAYREVAPQLPAGGHSRI